MKKTFWGVFVLCLAELIAFAQGTVNFNNKVNATVGPPPTPAIDAPISYAAGTPLGGASGAKIDGATHPTAWVALYGGPVGTPEDQLVLLAPGLQFRSGAAAGYVNTLGNASRAVPGVAPGAAAVVQLRAWDSDNGTIIADYETAILTGTSYVGKSAPVNIATGGAGAPPSNPGNIYGLSAFAIYGHEAPEPGTFALGLLGLAALFVLPRKK
jgi:hypothetical protein